MDFLHKELHLRAGDIVEVHASHPCIILVMEAAEFERYRRGKNTVVIMADILRYCRHVSPPRMMVSGISLLMPDGLCRICRMTSVFILCD